MADYFSDHYTATVSGTTVDDPRFKVDPGISHSKIYYKRATVTAPAAITTADVLRFFSLKTNDRPLELLLSSIAFTGTGQPADCGVYQAGGGAVVDVDLFGNEAAPLDDLSVAVVRADLFILGALEQEDRGKMLFQLADEGLASTLYDEDPHEEWDICLTMGTESAITAGGELIMECYYTSGGN